MISGHHRDLRELRVAFVGEDVAKGAPCAPPALRAEHAKGFRRTSPKRDDCLGAKHAQLTVKKRRTGARFVFFRGPVLRRAALHDIANVDLVARVPHRDDHLVQQFSRVTHERLALLVLVIPGPFANEHELGLLTATRKNALGPTFMKSAGGAGGGLVTEDRKRRPGSNVAQNLRIHGQTAVRRHMRKNMRRDARTVRNEASP